MKKRITIRIDGDILDWFKGLGGNYQSGINDVLRKHVNGSLICPQSVVENLFGKKIHGDPNGDCIVEDAPPKDPYFRPMPKNK
ncbi:MAG: BrnA antitoxin family protein [Candidatus Hodarchaeota archaeon]